MTLPAGLTAFFSPKVSESNTQTLEAETEGTVQISFEAVLADNLVEEGTWPTTQVETDSTSDLVEEVHDVEPDAAALEDVEVASVVKDKETAPERSVEPVFVQIQSTATDPEKSAPENPRDFSNNLASDKSPKQPMDFAIPRGQSPIVPIAKVAENMPPKTTLPAERKNDPVQVKMQEGGQSNANTSLKPPTTPQSTISTPVVFEKAPAEPEPFAPAKFSTLSEEILRLKTAKTEDPRVSRSDVFAKSSAPAAAVSKPPLQPITFATNKSEFADLIKSEMIEDVAPVSSSNRSEVSNAPARLEAPIQIARQVSQQVAYAVSQTGSGATEIKLSPEELGRVRMTVQAVEGMISVVVVAERTDVGDLMRRHSEILTQNLKEMGFDSIDLSFGSEASSEPWKTEDQELPDLPLNDVDEGPNPIAQNENTALSESLDIRL